MTYNDADDCNRTERALVRTTTEKEPPKISEDDSERDHARIDNNTRQRDT